MTHESSPLALPRDQVGPEDYDAAGRFLYPGDVEDAMPEGELAWSLGVYLVHAIRRLAADPARASAHANMPIYYVQGQPRRHVSPDAFYLDGVPMDEQRRSYCIWKTCVVPQVTFEVVSRGSEIKDEVVNRAIYQELGVAEYYWFDPERDLLTALGLDRKTGRYRKRRPNAAGRFASQALGLEVEVGRHEGRLALFQQGRYLPPLQDQLAEKDTTLAEKDTALAEQAAALAAKEAELEALRTLLAKQDSGPST